MTDSDSKIQLIQVPRISVKLTDVNKRNDTEALY